MNRFVMRHPPVSLFQYSDDSDLNSFAHSNKQHMYFYEGEGCYLLYSDLTDEST